MYNMTSQLGLISFEELLEKAKAGTDALLVLSGGLDSAYILWKYAQVVTDRPIHTHHIHLYPNWSQRLGVEDVAVRKQIEYLNREVSVRTSTVDTSSGGAVIRDITLAVLLSATAATERGCEYILVGDDLPSSARRNLEDSILDPYKERMNKAMAEYVRAVTEDTVDICMGMETHLVKEAYNEMPEDYLALVSSCRNPQSKHGRVSQCRECHSCKKNEKFGFLDRISKGLVYPSYQ